MSLFQGKLNSDYFKAYSLGKYVTVFVENEDDVPFWSRMLKRYASSHLKFRITFAFREELHRGKTELLILQDGAGDFMLICVDSDYDYLLQEATEDSKAINHNPYIFQTYTYSVENYRCFANSLAELCIQASLHDEPLFDFVEFLESYSVIVYELFVFSFYFRKIGDTSTFPVRDFSACFGIQGRINISENARAALQQLQTIIEQKVAAFKTSHPDADIEALAAELAQRGVQKTNTYLFVRGHTLYHALILPLLRSVVPVLKSHKRAEFVRQAGGNSEHLSRKQQEYQRQILDIDTLLAANTNYDDCFLMRYIQRDIEQYIRISQPEKKEEAEE